MTREEIKQIIPHREPMLLVDEIGTDGEYATAKYTIRENEFFTTGHFPGYPVVPGVILCEIMAQGSVMVIPGEDLKTHTTFYGGLNNVKFKKSVFPGDTVCTRTKLKGRRGPAVFVESVATVNDQVVCSGELIFMLVPNEKLNKQ